MKTLLRYLLVVTVMTGILVLALDRVIMPLYVSHRSERYLPDVRGLAYEDAAEKLELEGFIAMKGDTKLTNSFSPGTVIDQYPRAMRRVKPGRRIRLTVADREKMVPVPDLVGKSLRSARLEIEEVGLTIDSLITEYDVEVPADVVKWQYPRPGDYSRRGSGLAIIVSLGKPPNFYQVPQLFGLSLNKAEQLLREAHLDVGRITYRQNEDLIPYTVLEQSIEEGYILDHPVPVDLTVSIIDLDDVYKRATSPDGK